MKKKMLRLMAALLAVSLMAAFAGCKKKAEEEQPDDTTSSGGETQTQAGPSGGDIGKSGTMDSLRYWLDAVEAPGRVLMDAGQIAAYNDALTADVSSRCAALESYSESLGKAELTELLSAEKTPDDERYIGKSKATDAYYKKLTDNVNLAGVGEQNAVQYGYATDNLVMRTFPTADPSYEFADDLEFDLFAETLVKLWEPVVVLHTSADKKWFFVQTYNYRGWLPTEGVALADKAEWEKYLAPAQTLVVTGNRVTLNENVYSTSASGQELFMGTVLPLAEDELPATIDGMDSSSGWAVLLPDNEGGRLVVRQALVSYNADVSEGYLPYTQENLLRQAFKLLGDRHGWSGTQKSRDASALVVDIYQPFGLKLPRNSGQQAALPGDTTDLSGMNDSDKKAIIASLPVGSLLSMDSHVALYLGDEGGEPYVLHSLYVAYEPGGQQKIINAIAVTDLNLCDKDGNSYLSGMKTATLIQ